MSADDIKTILALWGAITGSVGASVALSSFFRDRARIKIRVSPMTSDEVAALGPDLTWGSHDYLLAELVNAGRRKMTIYYPELWVTNKHRFLKYETPGRLHHEGSWRRPMEHPWTAYVLEEGQAISFLFHMQEDDRFVKIVVSDSLARHTEHNTVSGRLRLLRSKLRPAKTWNRLRDEWFGKNRPRHHK